jgi:uroporphyrinogen-III synthase
MTASGIAAPLSGTTVLVTRPRDSGSALPRVLRRAGADVVWQPAIRIDQTLPTPELDEALRGLESFEWIAFTSVHGVAAFWGRASALGIDIEKTRSTKFAAVFWSPSAVQAMLPHRALIERSAVACIGPTTANAARAAGLRVRIVPPRATALALADAVIEHFHPGAGAVP